MRAIWLVASRSIKAPSCRNTMLYSKVLEGETGTMSPAIPECSMASICPGRGTQCHRDRKGRGGSEWQRHFEHYEVASSVQSLYPTRRSLYPHGGMEGTK